MELQNDINAEFLGLLKLLGQGEDIQDIVSDDLILLLQAASNIRFAYIMTRQKQVENMPMIGAQAFIPDNE